ncbi:MAG: hypothetical protein ACSHX6_17165 [Akkermansiaceae bacterium]
MKIPILKTTFISLIVFTISMLLITRVTHSLGTHSAFRSYIKLKQLHHFMILHLEIEEKPLPDEEFLNKMIKENYLKDPDHEVFNDTNDKNFSLLQFSQEISENHHLRLWGAPPIYIRDLTLPDGYGFYLAGEDGVSSSKGRDPDDVNSWNGDSFKFYTNRMRQRKIWRNTKSAFIPTLLTFLYCILRSRKTKSRFTPTTP